MIPLITNPSNVIEHPNKLKLSLIDCISCKVTEERNGRYELEMEYPSNGKFASNLVNDSSNVFNWIMAKPNYTDDPQYFEIYKVVKNMNGHYSINARHISYLMSNVVISSGSANNIVSAVSILNTRLLIGSGYQFSLYTTKNTPGDFTITEPSSVRSWFGGKKGSLLDVYGGGEWKYDNFTATLMQNRGEDRGVEIRYGKNLLEFSQEIDMTNLVYAVIPYYKGEDGTVITGESVLTGLPSVYRYVNRTISKDFTQDVVPDSEPEDILLQLNELATTYVNNNNFTLTTMFSNITLDFVQLKELSERVDLCDTVHIYFEPLGISATAKCISTTWDVLEERYTETVFGDPKASIVDSLQDTLNAADAAQNSAEEANANANTAIVKVGEKKRVFVDTPVPPYDIGDMWVNGVDIYYCIVPKKTTTTGEASGVNRVVFNTPLAEPLISCICTIPANSTGYDFITVRVADGNDNAIETYPIDFGQTITIGGTLNVIEGVLTLNDQEETTIAVTPAIVTTLAGTNRISCIDPEDTPVGRIEVEYLIEGFQKSDWNLASSYVSQSKLEDAINASTSVITGNSGGYVIFHDSDGDKKPDEILVMDTEDIKTALKVWRWNSGGLSFSSTGYNGPFSPAIDSEGRIVASMITTGNLDALKVTIEHLTASMFEGSKISLGGINNQSGVLELKDEAGTVIGELTKDGLKFYGAGPVGQRPYVVLNNTDGFKGYDALGNPLFWVNRDEFNMKKCVAVNEISACGILKMLPMTIENNGTVVNKGLAFIPIV